MLRGDLERLSILFKVKVLVGGRAMIHIQILLCYAVLKPRSQTRGEASGVGVGATLKISLQWFVLRVPEYWKLTKISPGFLGAGGLVHK